MKLLQSTLTFFLTVLLLGCSSSGSTWGCLGASNPIDLTLKNDAKGLQVVTLFSYTDQNGFVKIEQLSFGAFEEKEMCLNKDALKHGLYLFNGVDAYGLTFDSSSKMKVNLNDSQYQITSAEQLRDLTKAM